MRTHFVIGNRTATYLALIFGVSLVCAARVTHADDADGYKAEILVVDARPVGSVDRKVVVMVTNAISHSAVELSCLHSPLSSDWNIELGPVKVLAQASDGFNDVMARVVADSVRITAALLKKDYPPDPVACIVLLEEKMPDPFTRQLYLSLA